MGGSGFVLCCYMLWTDVHALVGLQIQNSTKMWQGDYNSGTFSHWKRHLPWSLVIYAQELVGNWVLCSCTPRIYGSIALGWERLNDHWSALAHRWGFLIAHDRVIMISPLKFFLKTWLALLVEFTLGHLAVIVTQHCSIQRWATFLVHRTTYNAALCHGLWG